MVGSPVARWQALHFIGRVLRVAVDARDRDLDPLGHPLAEQDVVAGTHVFDDRGVELVPRQLDRRFADDAVEGEHRDVARTAADVEDEVAVRPRDVDTRADRRRDRLLDQVDAARAGLHGGVDRRLRLHASDERGHAERHPRFHHIVGTGLFHEVFDHRLGHLVVGDDPVLQRADGGDLRGRLAQHVVRLVPHAEHVPGAGVDRHDRGLPQHDAVRAVIDEYRRRSQVDPDVD